MSKAHGPLADRPINPKVGLEISHESAGAARHRQGAVHAGSGEPHQGHPARLAGPGAARPRPGHRPAGRAGLRRARGGPGADRRRRARAQRRRREARRTAVPDRGHVLRARRLLGARRDAWRPPGRAPTRSQVDYEPLPSLVTIQDAIAADSFQGHHRTVSRGDADAAMETAAHRFTGEFEFGGQEHFYLETNAALALVDENGQIFVQSSTQHPSETQDIVAHVLGIQAHHITVQCLRMGGGFGGKEFQPHGLAAIAALGAVLTDRPVSLRLNRTQDITMTGKRHPFLATWEVGFDDGQPDLRAAGHADQQRRLEPRPVRAGARPGALPHRQRLLDPEHHGARPDRQDQPELQHGVPRLRRPAGHDRHRGHPRPLRAAARASSRKSCGAATSTSPARRRRTGSRSGTPSGSPTSGRS